MYNKPLERSLYALTKDKAGEFLLYIDEKDLYYRFMQLPDRYEFFSTKEDFHKAVNDKIMDFIELVPFDVFEVSVANIIEKH